jgi:hypothetical protein
MLSLPAACEFLRRADAEPCIRTYSFGAGDSARHLGFGFKWIGRLADPLYIDGSPRSAGEMISVRPAAIVSAG